MSNPASLTVSPAELSKTMISLFNTLQATIRHATSLKEKQLGIGQPINAAATMIQILVINLSDCPITATQAITTATSRLLNHLC